MTRYGLVASLLISVHVSVARFGDLRGRMYELFYVQVIKHKLCWPALEVLKFDYKEHILKHKVS